MNISFVQRKQSLKLLICAMLIIAGCGGSKVTDVPVAPAAPVDPTECLFLGIRSVASAFL